MNRLGALLWLALIAASLAYMLVRLNEGITLQSDILALLPRTERSNSDQDVQDRVIGALSKRVAFLVGHRDATKARTAALTLAEALEQSGLVNGVSSKIDPEGIRQMGTAFFPYRMGLLSELDRSLLLDNNGKALVDRALSLLYSPGGFTSTNLIKRDPFLLLPAYFFDLPIAQSRLRAEDGVLTVLDGEETFVLVSADLSGNPFALRYQTSFHNFLMKSLGALQAQAPGLTVLRTGAIFFAREGATGAMSEASIIGSISIAATLAMILIVFRGLRPIVLSLAAIAAGILCAFVGTILIYGEIHAVALLFGASLIGVSVDYSFQYFCEDFDPDAHDPSTRLQRVLPGITIGLATTLIGYTTLLLAPFPGLQQVSAFSLIGLCASFLTVVLWYPLLDNHRAPTLNNRFVKMSALHWALWQAPELRFARFVIVMVCVAAGIAGAFQFHVNDDVRDLQALSPDLKRQELELKRLTGWSADTQYLLVHASSEQAVLEVEEELVTPLSAAVKKGFLSGYTTVAQFVPSVARQTENRNLVRTRLVAPYLETYTRQIGYEGTFDFSAPTSFAVLANLPRVGPLSLLAILNVGGKGNPAHVVLLQGVTDIAAVKKLIAEFPNVQYVSLADDWSQLFGDYRRYSIALLALSACLMYPMLWWRYGWLGALQVLAPSTAAVILAPAIAALAGVAFTFFNAMALVLVLSIGIDYSVFCRESSGVRKPVTTLGIALAALSTILSFGMLSMSQVFAVHAFGMTMLIGIAFAFLFAPAAGDGEPKTGKLNTP